MLYSLYTFFKSLLEITLIAAAFYFIYIWIRGTRAVQVLNGFVVLFLAFMLSRFLGMTTITWILGKVFAFSILAFLILFQPELRRALAQLGRRPLFFNQGAEEDSLAAVVKAVEALSRSKTGALIAIEREIGLGSYILSGVKLDARVTAELLISLFQPRSPLHDGGAIVVGDRVAAAGCVFPLSQRLSGEKKTGTRHKAAVGLSEETDAIVVVVSEETGKISIARTGVLSQELTLDALSEVLLKSKNKSEPIETAAPVNA